MKFDMHQYWKHQNCMDVFILIHSIVQDTGKVAILNVQWMIQGTAHYWATKQDRIKINPKEYAAWKPYTPKGTYYC